jgi:hypothetical protein
LYILAASEIANHTTGNVFKNGLIETGEIVDTVSLMPVKQIFKSLFSLPNVLRDVTQNIQHLENQDSISNFVNATRWNRIRQNYAPEDIVIPFDLYNDDFETGNALGSNAGTHKIAAYYVSFPCFPQHLNSSPKYVFEVLLYRSQLNPLYMKKCLEKLVIVLKDLEKNGLEIDYEGEKRTVYFILARLIGDNLALNELLGFRKGFNANKFCRICTLAKAETHVSTISSDTDLRSIESYDADLQKKNEKVTGIREECIFNQLDNFHCVENIVCDLMHDLFEGVVKYDLAFYLQKLIENASLPRLTLEVLNSLKQNFNYGSIEIGNLSKPIEASQLTDSSLKMSASEMKTFLLFLPLIIGHLIPRNNKIWSMILLLIDIAEFSLLPEFDDDALQKFKKVIMSYFAKYTKIVGKPPRPKLHFITHYIQCVQNNGPLRYNFEKNNFLSF